MWVVKSKTDLSYHPGKPLFFWSKACSLQWTQWELRLLSNNDFAINFWIYEWLCNTINQLLYKSDISHSQPESAVNIVDWLMNSSMNFLPGVVVLHLRVFLFQVIIVCVSLEQGSFPFWAQMVWIDEQMAWIECWSLLMWSETTSNSKSIVCVYRVFHLACKSINYAHLLNCKTCLKLLTSTLPCPLPELSKLFFSRFCQVIIYS